jgi:hypothetical protein
MHKLCKSRVISHLSASPDRLLYDIENSFEIIVKVVYRCCLRASREVIAFILTEWVVQTGKSKDDRRCTLSTDELSTPAGQPALSVRPHRSRLQRPCDGCRKAKQASRGTRPRESVHTVLGSEIFVHIPSTIFQPASQKRTYCGSID